MENWDKKRLQNALCFFPLVAFVIYFLDMEKDNELKQNVNRGMILFAFYFIFSIILPVLFVGSFIWVSYILLSLYLWVTVYRKKINELPIVDESIKQFEKFIKNK